MNAKEYISQYVTDNGDGMISYESIIQLMEEYHQAKIKEELPTEEEINAILSIKAKLYGEKDSEHGEEYPVRAVPHYMWHSVSKAIINLLER